MPLKPAWDMAWSFDGRFLGEFGVDEAGNGGREDVATLRGRRSFGGCDDGECEGLGWSVEMLSVRGFAVMASAMVEIVVFLR